jgi:hypothetical protein
MERKKNIAYSAIMLGVATVAVVFALFIPRTSDFADVTAGNQYTLTLNKNNRFTLAAETDHVVLTTSGNQVHLAGSGLNTGNADYFAVLSGTAGSYIEMVNQSKIKGIQSLTINTNTQDGRYKVMYGLVYGTYPYEEIYRTGSWASGWENTTYTINTVVPANYFRIETLSDSTANYLRSIVINYSCEETSTESEKQVLETNTGDLLADYEFADVPTDMTVVKDDTANLALSDSGYAAKLVAPAGYSGGYSGPCFYLHQNYDLTNKNLVILIKVTNLFPDLRVVLCNRWDALNTPFDVHIGDAWAGVGNLDNCYRAVTIRADQFAAKMISGKNLSVVNNIKILFPFGENNTKEQTIYIDRIVVGEGLFGFSNANGSSNSYQWTSIPLTADGSQIPAEKSVQFKIKEYKAPTNYTVSLFAFNGAATAKDYGNIINNAGVRNTADYDADGVIFMKMSDDGYWLVKLAASGFSAAPTKLVLGRWNEAMGFIKDITIVN